MRGRFAFPLAAMAPLSFVAVFSWWSASQFKHRYFDPILEWYFLVALIACFSVAFGFAVLRGKPTCRKDWGALLGYSLALAVFGVFLTNSFHVYYFPRF
jgi:hypothetical protein